MPVTMYNMMTGKNIKVYGFVGNEANPYAVTYQLNPTKELEQSLDNLRMKLVPAICLRPLDI